MDENNKNPRFLFLVIVLLITAALGTYFYYLKHKQGQQSETTMALYNRQFADAKTDRFSGNYGVAVEKFKALVAGAPDKETEGLNKIFLAESLYSRNENDDIFQAMKIYKSVVNDYKIPPKVRASALNGIAAIIDKNDNSFYKLYFAEPPYSTFLPEAGTERSRISKAFLSILKLSDETFPNSYAEYMTAARYADLAANNSLDDGITPKEAAETILKYVSDGDSLKEDDSRYADSANLTRYLNRAIAINIGGKILGKQIEERESGFKLAMEKATPFETSDDQFARTVIMRLHFFYANFLMVNLDGGRHDEIKWLLKPYDTAATSSELWAENTRRNFTGILNQRPGDILIRRAVELARISPEFRTFVESVGIK
ncbi:MAG: hypothetical protein Q7S08_03610 [bacterium]|nr:hypothetical protein [bacterium]